MNTDRILALADLIEKQPLTDSIAADGFYMGSYTHECGTPSCIAGWAAWESLGRPAHMKLNDEWGVSDLAAEFLGISDEQRRSLFLMSNSNRSYHGVSPTEAAAVIRRFAATGEVDWSVQP